MTYTKAILIPAGFAIVLFVVPPLLAYSRLIPQFPAFLAWIFSLVPAVIALLVGAHAATKGEAMSGMVSLLIGLVPILVIGYGAINGRKFPPINDISTNLDNPPQFVAAAQAKENIGKDLAYPAGYRGPAQAAYPDLLSLQLPLPLAATFELVKSTAEAIPHWQITRIDVDTMTIEGEETAGIFQFTDDFVIRVLSADSTTQIDMRSRSRVGQADFGANAQRIRRFFTAVNERAQQTKN